jgi:hypothetical protein
MRWFVLILFILVIWGCSEDENTLEPDTIRPTIVSTYPAANDSNININSPINCIFSEEMDAASINDSSFIVKWIMEFPGVITYDNKIATHTHAAPMRPGCMYSVTIKGSVCDLAGNILGKDYSWLFHTYDDFKVHSTFPNDGDTGISLISQISVTFTNPVDPLTVTPLTYYLSNRVTGSVVSNGNQVVLTPDVFLENNHTYMATISQYVADTAGNTLYQDYQWLFTTTGGPKILKVLPVDSAVDIDLDTEIEVHFSTDMDPATITPASFYISDVIYGTITYENAVAKIRPTDSLLQNHDYVVTVKSSVADFAGNTMADDYTWSFRTVQTDFGDIMPLAIGNRWIYYTETWDTLGWPTGARYDTVIIVSDTIIDGINWFNDNRGGRYSHQEGGLWKYWSGNLCLLAMYPAEVGEMCNNCPQYANPLNPQLEVLTTDWQVTVDPGTYSCYRYYMSFGYYEPIVYYFYYSPGTGLILEETYMLHGWKSWPCRIKRRALISYNFING